MFRNLHTQPKHATPEQIAADKRREERAARTLEAAQASEPEAPMTLADARAADQSKPRTPEQIAEDKRREARFLAALEDL